MSRDIVPENNDSRPMCITDLFQNKYFVARRRNGGLNASNICLIDSSARLATHHLDDLVLF
jgi:hypothetical protein